MKPPPPKPFTPQPSSANPSPDAQPSSVSHKIWVPHPRDLLSFSPRAITSDLTPPAPDFQHGLDLQTWEIWEPIGPDRYKLLSSTASLSAVTLRRLTFSTCAQISPTGTIPRNVISSSIAAHAVAASGDTPKNPVIAAATSPI